MSDLQKIVVLCVVGLVLLGVFFYSLSSSRPDEQRQLEAIEQTEYSTSSAPNTSDNATTSAPATTTDASRPDEDRTLPPSSDTGMEFPIVE